MTASWLIDKSALVRLGSSVDAEVWANRIERGLVAITTVTLLEAGFSARSAGDLGRALGSAPVSSMPVEYLTPAAEDRTVDVQRLLAAVAELSQRTVLHLDKDFELIADLTGQPLERLRIADA